MTNLAAAREGYGSAAAPTRSEKSIEYDVLAQITRRLKSAAEKGPSGFSALASALHDNKRLWNVFAIDVADPNNKLPESLRARLFYLAEFTHAHTSAVLQRRAKVAPLIDINMAVLRGLRGGSD
ncbi:MAG: flagellar biosynthesis regulator FlhF [Rhodobacteraceae bacterium]|nr:flagellar biosynthesis regulator FlhF [Paracoccaceae bacterium]